MYQNPIFSNRYLPDGSIRRTVVGVIGAMRSGKTFFANLIARYYQNEGNSIWAYNVSGKQNNYPNAQMLKLLDMQQHERLMARKGNAILKDWQRWPSFEFFKDDSQPNKVFNIKEFPKLYYQKAVKSHRLPTREIESLFFTSFFDYVSNCLLILDDCREIFRYGMSDNTIRLFSRANHCGESSIYPNYVGQGNDIILILHDIDDINPQMWSYLTHVVLFKTNSDPTLKTTHNPALNETLKIAAKEIKNAVQQGVEYPRVIIEVENPLIYYPNF